MNTSCLVWLSIDYIFKLQIMKNNFCFLELFLIDCFFKYFALLALLKYIPKFNFIERVRYQCHVMTSMKSQIYFCDFIQVILAPATETISTKCIY